jgi:hypothetical protein
MPVGIEPAGMNHGCSMPTVCFSNAHCTCLHPNAALHLSAPADTCLLSRAHHHTAPSPTTSTQPLASPLISPGSPQNRPQAGEGTGSQAAALHPLCSASHRTSGMRAGSLCINRALRQVSMKLALVQQARSVLVQNLLAGHVCINIFSDNTIIMRLHCSA